MNCYPQSQGWCRSSAWRHSVGLSLAADLGLRLSGAKLWISSCQWWIHGNFALPLPPQSNGQQHFRSTFTSSTHQRPSLALHPRLSPSRPSVPPLPFSLARCTEVLISPYACLEGWFVCDFAHLFAWAPRSRKVGTVRLGPAAPRQKCSDCEKKKKYRQHQPWPTSSLGTPFLLRIWHCNSFVPM